MYTLHINRLHIMSELIMQSRITDNYIKMFLDNENSVWIENYYIDSEYVESDGFKIVEEFCKMMDEGFNELKSRGGISHKQYVPKHEVTDTFIKRDERWEIIGEDEDTYLMECDIDDAMRCIIEGFLGSSLENENK